MEQVRFALSSKSFSDAEQIADDILARDPNNQRAQDLKRTAVNAQKARRLQIALVAAGVAAIALFALVAGLYGKFFKKDKDDSGSSKPAAAKSGAPAGAGVGVYVQVIDGVGRGKLAPIGGDLFRIGAAAGADDGDRNDLVISDNKGAVSRFHCTVMRKGRNYFLIDSSLNGTRVNNRLMERGESYKLRDGDSFTVADVALLKFVKS